MMPKYDGLLTSVPFKFNLRRYNEGFYGPDSGLTMNNPGLGGSKW